MIKTGDTVVLWGKDFTVVEINHQFVSVERNGKMSFMSTTLFFQLLDEGGGYGT